LVPPQLRHRIDVEAPGFSTFRETPDVDVQDVKVMVMAEPAGAVIVRLHDCPNPPPMYPMVPDEAVRSPLRHTD